MLREGLREKQGGEVLRAPSPIVGRPLPAARSGELPALCPPSTHTPRGSRSGGFPGRKRVNEELLRGWDSPVTPEPGVEEDLRPGGWM